MEYSGKSNLKCLISAVQASQLAVEGRNEHKPVSKYVPKRLQVCPRPFLLLRNGQNNPEQMEEKKTFIFQRSMLPIIVQNKLYKRDINWDFNC